jgi:2-polyprenyl-6-methoxyphenol hydroxylase-like FAD-dependent oxidoreductase
MSHQYLSPSKTQTHGRHAIVMGGSMAGLLAARVLSDHFKRVTLIERDRLHDSVGQRKGVPQGQHLHVLLVKGEQSLSQLFPGLVSDLVRDGAVRFDFCHDLRWFQEGGYKTRFQGGIVATAMSRALLEYQVRRRVLALENVTCLDQGSVTRLLASTDNRRITGVKLRRRTEGPATSQGSGQALSRAEGMPEESLMADLVVDATGRGSRSPQWLEALGYPRPAESAVTVNLGYASRIYRQDHRLLPDALGVMTTPAPPDGWRGGLLAPLEGNRWIVTFGGWLGDHPSADEAGFLDFARSLPAPDIYQVISRAEPLSEIATYKLPSNLRRHFESVKQFPEGYLVLGDAICSFNPVYGQGMTVSALEAESLQRCLQKRHDLRGLAHDFFKQAAKSIENPWTLAVGEDFRFPGVEGPKPPATDMINRYISQVHRTSFYDRESTLAFFQVMNMMTPPTSLFHLRMMWRIIKGRLAQPQPSAGAPAIIAPE